MSETLKEIENFKRRKLKELLFECTMEQRDLFNRMYKSADEIPEEKIPRAIQQCERTIEKNSKQ